MHLCIYVITYTSNVNSITIILYTVVRRHISKYLQKLSYKEKLEDCEDYSLKRLFSEHKNITRIFSKINSRAFLSIKYFKNILQKNSLRVFLNSKM